MSLEILHVAHRPAWEHALATGDYPASARGMTYADEGFVHCSLPRQVDGVLDRYYSDIDPAEWVVLVLDTALIEADGVEVKFETSDSAGDDFPHIYAPLRPSWVVRTEDIVR